MVSGLVRHLRGHKADAKNVLLKTRLDLGEDVTRIFRHHIFHYMPVYLLSIKSDYKTRHVRFKLIRRDDLRAEDYITEKEITSFLAKSPGIPREEVIRKLVAKAQGLRYATFSHCWSHSEATFDMVRQAGTAGLGTDAPQGYKKLERFCAMALENGYQLAWADTACIDKRSSAELEQAIRSMFNWYRNSAVCIIYLAESMGMDDFADEPWFKRGWTLQELLAPKQVKFYAKDWTPIKSLCDCRNDKDDSGILQAVSRITGIKEYDLRYFSPGLLNVREKMVWASQRRTTLEEDIAYSLLGIFDISMPITYGEGKRAFRRLMEVIVQDCREWQIFAWAGRHSPYATAFPESPCGYGLQFLGEVDACVIYPERPIHRPWDYGYPFYTMTKKGLEIKVILVEMMLQIDRESICVAGRCYEHLMFRPALEDQRYFDDVRAVCDSKFLRYSRWAVGIISYQTDGNVEQDETGELDGNRHHVCFLLGTGIHSPYGKWEKVGTKQVLTIGTKEVVRKDLTTLWL